MARIEIVFFAWSDLRVPYIDGELIGDGTGLVQGYASQMLQWMAQTSISDDINNDLKSSIVEAEIPITLTQMAALVGRKPATFEEAKEIVASYE
ncbi:MAG: hypothetical protein ACYSW6_04880 [Planctomycetota bacterium]|jgi:hypothetical protein